MSLLNASRIKPAPGSCQLSKKRKRPVFLAASIAGITSVLTAANLHAGALVYSGTEVTETFDSLGETGTDTSLITGAGSFPNDGSSPWFIDIVTTATGNTAATTGGTFLDTVSDGTVPINDPAARRLNNGVAGINPVTDRALGTGNTAGDPVIDLFIRNTSGGSLSAITVSYDTEWWHGANGTAESFGYLLYYSPTGDANSWTVTPAIQPSKTYASLVSLDGNDPANRQRITVNFPLDTPVANNETFYLRWRDSNDATNSPDANIAIDNVTFSASTVLPPGKTVIWNLGHTVGGAPNGNLDTSGSNYWLSNGTAASFANNDVATFSQSPNGTATINVPADITPNATNVTNATGTYTIGGAGKIGGRLTKANAGTLILTSDNTFTGATLTGGTLVTRTTGSLGAGRLTVDGSGGTLQTETDLRITGINGAGPLVKTGAGGLFFSGSGNGIGGINLQAGKLSLSDAAGLGGSTQSVTLNGNPLEFTNTAEETFSDVANPRVINVGATATTIAVTAAGGGVIVGNNDSMTGSGTITKAGPGALRMRADHPGLTSNWVVTEGTLESGQFATPLGSGTVTVNAGARLAGQNFAVPSNVTLAGGELGTRTNDLTDFQGAINVTADSSVFLRSYTTNANGQHITISGVLSGSGGLTINGNPASNPPNPNGPKALILTNTGNTYTGTITVTAEQALIVNGSLAATSNVSVDGRLGGRGTIGRAAVNALGTLAPGLFADTSLPAPAPNLLDGPGILSSSGNVTLAATAILALDLDHGVGASPVAGTDYDQLVVGGTVTLGGSDLVLTIGLNGILPNDRFFILINDGSDPIPDTFNNLPDKSFIDANGQVVQISYKANSTTGSFTGGNDIALVAIPEIGSVGLLMLGSALLVSRRRRS